MVSLEKREVEMLDTSLLTDAPQSEFYSEFKKPRNSDRRSREYLTEEEIRCLLQEARKLPRYGVRNHCLILTMFRHGLRAGEAASLRWSDVDLKAGRIHVRRLKGGNASVHPIYGDELRSLRQLERQRKTSFVFESERGSHLSPSGIHQIIASLGSRSNFDFPIHAHMLRHSCGYYLANKGMDTRLIQDWLGHKNISCTVVYTRLAPNRFEGIFDE